MNKMISLGFEHLARFYRYFLTPAIDWFFMDEEYRVPYSSISLRLNLHLEIKVLEAEPRIELGYTALQAAA